MTYFILLPLALDRPYELVSQGSVYTEDVIKYNDLYLQLFNVTGGAVDGDFLLFSYYEVKSVGRAIVSVSVFNGSATIYGVAVFVIRDVIELLNSRAGSDIHYIYSFDLKSGETYGVAVFGHKETNNIDVEIGFTVAM